MWSRRLMIIIIIYILILFNIFFSILIIFLINYFLFFFYFCWLNSQQLFSYFVPYTILHLLILTFCIQWRAEQNSYLVKIKNVKTCNSRFSSRFIVQHFFNLNKYKFCSHKNPNKDTHFDENLRWRGLLFVLGSDHQLPCLCPLETSAKSKPRYLDFFMEWRSYGG